MPVTTTGELDAGILQKIQDEFILWAIKGEVYGQFVNWKTIPLDGGGASAYRRVVVHGLPVATTAVSETADITPRQMADSYFDITPDYYADAVALSKKLRYQSHTNISDEAVQAIGQQRAATVDRLIRAGLLSGGMTLRVGNLTARTDLDVTNDLINYTFLSQLTAYAGARGVEPYEGGHFVTVAHDQVIHAIRTNAATLWQTAGTYRTDQDGLYNGEVGLFAGIRFIRNPRGKIYIGGGTVAQTATTITADAAAGATSVTVADRTGIVAGDFVTLGTLEAATAEKVQVTASGAGAGALTVRGIGNAAGNQGCRYAHATGEAVTESADVACIPIFGKNSIFGVYGADEGQYGKVVVKPEEGVVNQFKYIGWSWYGGVNISDRHVVLGEFALPNGFMGCEDL